MAKIELKGFDALRAELKKFPEKVQARAVQTGVRKAASNLRTAMRRGAYAKILTKDRKRTNKLRYSIRSAVGKRPQYKGKAWVGLKLAPGETKVLSYYKTLERGRKAYTSKRRGSVRGSPPLKPFWERTWQSQRAAVREILIRETQKAIAYEAGKAYARSRGGR